MITDFANEVQQLNQRLSEIRRFFDVGKLTTRQRELESMMADPAFWNSQEKARATSSEAATIKTKLENYQKLSSQIGDLQAYQELMAAETNADERANLEKEAHNEFHSINKRFTDFELSLLLSRPEDGKNAILSIHAGAGGTEAHDWADMLLRMFRRYCERHDFEVSITDILQGESAGIKSATFLVKGINAYGYLKNERGVHRLVRISPFDSNARRHTSFASLDVLAELDDTIQIEILDKDIRIDTYRSSGAGGQHVNKTDSAVRITHLPTGIVVACQNERSQIKNRVTGMRILKSRLYELEMDKKRAEIERHYSEKGDIAFGMHIRSYVLQPYQLVKDRRTGEQTSNVQAVLDGDLDAFVEAMLKGKKAGAGEADLE
ncbi:MAG: peptide chain release factor 2 [Verrucomicrobiae bacterium]|nr:peptide chain release factor 2 [Verrucomicrobiae bacterium]